MNRLSLLGTGALIVAGIGFILIGCWLRSAYAPEWLLVPKDPTVKARPWAVESDCYSQLARDQRILHGQGLIQNHFTVENWPEGLTPSTTAPFDYAILLLYAPLTLFTKFPLDWAGALISPALWLGLVAFWTFFRSREFNRFGRFLLIAGSAALPALVWATCCGRPRHQSLILALMAIGLTAEYERWHVELSPKRAWNIFAGIVWGLACWTSLFEPLFVIVVLVAFNFIVRRRESSAFLISFGVVMLVALILEGPHIYFPPPEYHDSLYRWLSTIAEVRGIGFAEFFQQMMYLSYVILVPLVAWRLLCQPGDHRTDKLVIILTIFLVGFTLLQRRWTYYASLAELLLIVRYCQTNPLRWTRLLVMAFVLLGVLYDNNLQIEGRRNAPSNLPSEQLVEVSRAIDGPGGIMAPWWLSPSLLYFSGQPIVSGSSHCGISGIVDSARFYTATSWVDAEKILQKRQVRWIVIMDDPAYVYPVVNTSRGILGKPFYLDNKKDDVDQTVGQILITDRMVPTYLQLRAVTQQLKLYEYVPR